MKKKLWTVLLALILTASLLCGTLTAVAEAPAGKHINAALYWFGTSLDPAVDYDGWTLMRVGVAETLVTIDENLNIAGQLADSWEMLDDTTWKMHIREGVTFHNGKPVDAAAVKASIERVMSMQERGKTAAKIASVEADGQYVTFVTEEPFGAFLANLSEPLYSIIDVDAGTDPQSQPIGTGPFMVTGFTVNEVIETARYEGYWNGASDVESMTIRNIGDDSTRSLALQAGEIDVMQRVSAADMPLFEGNGDYAVYNTQGTRIWMLIMNHERAVIQDIAVRKALAASINYEALTRILGAGVSVAGMPYPASSPYVSDALTPQGYDPELAAATLAEAGYVDADGNGYVEKDGQELTLTISYHHATMNSACEAIQDMAKQVGIRIELKFMESTSELETSHDFDLMLRSVQSLSTGDPQWLLDNMYRSGVKTNWGSYSNAALDAICDQLTLAFEPEERIALTIEAEKLILEDCANIWLVATDNFVVSSARVKNVTPYPIDYYFVTNTMTIE